LNNSSHAKLNMLAVIKDEDKVLPSVNFQNLSQFLTACLKRSQNLAFYLIVRMDLGKRNEPNNLGPKMASASSKVHPKPGLPDSSWPLDGDERKLLQQVQRSLKLFVPANEAIKDEWKVVVKKRKTDLLKPWPDCSLWNKGKDRLRREKVFKPHDPKIYNIVFIPAGETLFQRPTHEKRETMWLGIQKRLQHPASDGNRNTIARRD